MADHIQLNTGSGGDVLAADEIGGVKYQRHKLTLGADGTNDGDVSATNLLPVRVGNDTAFGEVLVAELTPIVQAEFVYGLNTRTFAVQSTVSTTAAVSVSWVEDI